jgi:ribosome maturation factor RimP
VLSVYIDKPGGVTAADCQHMAEQLSLLLDAIDPIEGAYHLVVSSPGVERPLLRDSDFDRFAGRQAAVTDTTDAGRQTRQGTLLGVEAGHVLLETEDGVLRIALETIDGGHLVYDFDDDLLA